MKQVCRTAIQIVIFIVIAKLMNILVSWLHLPVPGSILGMLLMFLLLQLKVIPLSSLEAGSNWLIATMLLFFIPPAVGIISYRQLIVTKGVQIALVIGLGTVIVMVVSGLVAQSFAKRKERSMS